MLVISMYAAPNMTELIYIKQDGLKTLKRIVFPKRFGVFALAYTKRRSAQQRTIQ